MAKTFDVSHAGEICKINGKMRVFVSAAVLVVLGLLVYRDTLSELISSVLHREDASHGLCVPFISGTKGNSTTYLPINNKPKSINIKAYSQ